MPQVHKKTKASKRHTPEPLKSKPTVIRKQDILNRIPNALPSAEEQDFLSKLQQDVERDGHIPGNVKQDNGCITPNGEEINNKDECLYIPIYAAKCCGYLTENQFKVCGLRGHTINPRDNIYWGNLEKNLIFLKNENQTFHTHPKPTNVGVEFKINVPSKIHHFFIVESVQDNKISAIHRTPDVKSQNEFEITTGSDEIHRLYISIESFANIIKEHLPKPKCNKQDKKRNK